ncbi:MAG: phosphoribosyl-AMP cyclohydrolase [Cellvibrionales bacterium]|nr:phosphoribosyl-AMP cyclohydrolase [Cellvibrionales bacterium]
MNTAVPDGLRWNAEGLLPAIAQEHDSGEVLMLAWMNAEALRLTLAEGVAVYWSRSRQKIWRKGETSGHTQILRSLSIDCDSDCLLLRVEQRGGIACHTGRRSCFYRDYTAGQWRTTAPVLRDPAEIYGS